MESGPACKKGFMDFFHEEADADIFCIQDQDTQESQFGTGDSWLSSVLECAKKK